jgi:LemA protein
MAGWIFLGIIVLIALWAVTIFNRLVRQRNLVLEGWSGIDVQLKRRHNLIPNLVETVKGYMKHEEGVLSKVVELRNSAAHVGTPGEASAIETDLTRTLRQLFALAEAYPDLKANQNFLDLQGQLSAFPSNLIAGMFGFKEAEFFEIELAEERQVPEVSFKG